MTTGKGSTDNFMKYINDYKPVRTLKTRFKLTRLTMKFLTFLTLVVTVLGDEASVCLNCQQTLELINQLTAKGQCQKTKSASGEDWTLTFRGTAYIGKSVYEAYKDGTGIPSEVEPGCKQVTEPLPCSNHYRNKEVFDSWDRVEKVAFIVYSNYTKVKEILFDGSGSTYMDWFDKTRVKFSTWKQIKTDVTNFFSIEGYIIPVKAVKRTFFVNSIYNGCPNDKGWFVAIDIAGGSNSCDWERNSTFPVFKYARQNQAENWNTGDVGIADMFAIFVKYYDMP